MRAAQSRQVVVRPVVVLPGGVAPPRLEQADHVGIGVGPEAFLLLRPDRVQVVAEGVVRARLGHRQVAGQQIEQRRNVGGALDAGVAPQRHDAAARATDIAHQELQNRCSADELGPEGVLSPPDGVREAGGALAPGVLDDGAGEVVEILEADAADVAHHLRGVAGEVPLDDLEYRPRVLQGFRRAAPEHAPAVDRSRRARRPRRAPRRWRRAHGHRRGRCHRLLARHKPTSTGRTGPSRDRSRRTDRRDLQCP